MSLRRVCTVAGRLLVLALLASIVPACKKKVDNSPHITSNATPAPDAAGVPHFPKMILEWDRALNPATLNGNIVIYNTDQLGTPTTVFGGGTSIDYLDGSFQTVIINGAAFADLTEYCVLVFPGLESDKGVAANANPAGALALRFRVGNNANANQPAFSPPTQNVGAGAAGEIVWTWTQAQEGGPPVAITATYDFYEATVVDGQDLFGSVFFTSTNGTGATMPASLGLITGTTYHFRVICRDSAGNMILTADFTGVPD